MRSRRRAAFSNARTSAASSISRGEAVADRAAAPGQEIARLADELGIVGNRDLAGAGRRAALDLIEQAGARAVLVIAVRTGAQQEGALQRVERAMNGAGAGEGAEIIALAGPRAAMLEELRRLMIAGDQDIGKALVVAQQHIVARLHLLDEIGLEQQRLGLGFRRDEHHRGGLRDHARDAGRLPLGPGVAGDALLDAARLADIEHLAVGGEHAIDAGAVRRMAPEGFDDLRAARERTGLGVLLPEVEIDAGEGFVLVVLRPIERGLVGRSAGPWARRS